MDIAENISALEQEFEVDIDDALLRGFEGETYVVADSVRHPTHSEHG